MKKAFKKLLSGAMALVLLATMSITAFAAPGDVNGGGAGSLVKVPSSSGEDTSIEVTFAAGTGYELDAQTGTTTKKDGSVVITLAAANKLPEKKIPGITAADAYYDILGWAIKDKDGNLKEIDLATYKFSSPTKVYPILEDTWPLYLDMKQDRSDWYYIYVRDLSIAGVVNGYPGYLFGPADNTTWGAALKLIMLAAGYAEQDPVDAHWASGYLATARADGLVAADAEIDLDAPLTRLEYAHVAAKALELEESETKTPFADTEDKLVVALYEIKIFEGSFNLAGERLFKPNDYVTRSEISTVIWRINNYQIAQATA